MKRIDHWKWRLSSGRELDAVCDTFGLNVLENTAHHGHDDTYIAANPEGAELHGGGMEPDDGFWTDAERAELADFMIEKWRAFKAGT